MKKLLLIAAFCGLAHAEFRDGNELLSEINSSNSDSRIYSLAYIAGVADAYRGLTFCPPETVTLGQLRDMVRNYLTNVPAERHIPADRLINKVISGTWLCKRGTGT